MAFLLYKKQENDIYETTTNYYMFLPPPLQSLYSPRFPVPGQRRLLLPLHFPVGIVCPSLIFISGIVCRIPLRFSFRIHFPSLYFLYISFGAVLPGASVLASRPIPSHPPHAWSFPVRIFLFLSAPAASVYLFAVYIFILICPCRFGLT